MNDLLRHQISRCLNNNTILVLKEDGLWRATSPMFGDIGPFETYDRLLEQLDSHNRLASTSEIYKHNNRNHIITRRLIFADGKIWVEEDD